MKVGVELRCSAGLLPGGGAKRRALLSSVNDSGIVEMEAHGFSCLLLFTSDPIVRGDI